MSRFYAVIDPASSRYPGWCRTLGCDFVPVLSSEAEEILLQPDNRVERCYLVDFNALTPDLANQIVVKTARDNGVEVGEVLAEFVDAGFPILAQEVVICQDPNEGRLRFPFWANRNPVADFRAEGIGFTVRLGALVIFGTDKLASVHRGEIDGSPIHVEDNRLTGFEVQPSAFDRAVGWAQAHPEGGKSA